MAWTTPKTWSVGETLTAANFNTHIRDNQLAEGPHLVVRKTSDETVVSSTTLQDDNQLILPVAANEIWQFTFGVVATGVDGADIKVAFTFPASGEIGAACPWEAQGGGFAVRRFNGSTTPTPAENFRLYGATAKVFFAIQGIFINSTNAGSLTMQWAQASSNATATTVRANSTLWAVKLA